MDQHEEIDFHIFKELGVAQFLALQPYVRRAIEHLIADGQKPRPKKYKNNGGLVIGGGLWWLWGEPQHGRMPFGRFNAGLPPDCEHIRWYFDKNGVPYESQQYKGKMKHTPVDPNRFFQEKRFKTTGSFLQRKKEAQLVPQPATAKSLSTFVTHLRTRCVQFLGAEGLEGLPLFPLNIADLENPVAYIDPVTRRLQAEALQEVSDRAKSAAKQRQAAAAEIQDLYPIALKQLKNQGWPNAALIHPNNRSEVAAVIIGRHHWGTDRGGGTATYFLTTTEELWKKSSSTWERLCVDDLTSITNYLEPLRQIAAGQSATD